MGRQSLLDDVARSNVCQEGRDRLEDKDISML
jgi:hypothetical protein